MPNAQTNTATTRDIGVTIVDDEDEPTLSITGVTGNAINIMEDAGPLVLELVLTGPSSDEVISFNYEVADGTAEEGTGAGKDFTGPTTAMAKMIMSGSSSRIEIPILDEDMHEADETFTITLSSLQNATFATGFSGTITVTIQNDDPLPTLTVSSPTSSIPEIDTDASVIFAIIKSIFAGYYCNIFCS